MLETGTRLLRVADVAAADAWRSLVSITPQRARVIRRAEDADWSPKANAKSRGCNGGLSLITIGVRKPFDADGIRA